ncbi:MAG TPA: LysR family transcriptional regulator [Kaistiaceae bacterium]|nr:LysR family transcriptional regulator [Kaistiaceae bacterium]
MSVLSDMEIFARVVTAGSLSAAGREVSLSPAVVSKSLRRLEERLGTRLLQRTTRRIALTEAGQGYFERVVAILASVEEAEDFVSRRSTLARGTLKVSVPTAFGRMHIAPHLGTFFAANPGILLQLSLSDSLVDLVGEGYDLAIRIAALDDSSLVARRLAPVRRLLCATPAYLDRRGAPRSIEDLASHNCLTTTAQETWRLEGPEGRVSFKPGGNLLTNSSEVVREALLCDLGIALRSTWDVGPQLRDGTLRVVLPQFGTSSDVAIHAVYPSRRFLPAKVRVFIDFLSELYGNNPYWDQGLEKVLPKP